jgi:methionyl-tRNA formyltransferase
MRIIFMGAPEFAVPTLQEIVGEGHVVAAAYTRAPKPGGRRGLEIKKTPVHEAAETLGIPVFTPPTLKDEVAQEVFRGHAADLGLVIAYGLLLPVQVLEAPRFGCMNLHASLLPRWRGAAPIQRAIMTGDAETGVDLMRMDEGLDTGPVALREVVPIRPEDTAGDLTDRLAQIAAKLAARGLFAMECGKLRLTEQSSSGACYARKIDKNEGEIDWGRSAAQIRNQIHGLSPTPGAFSNLFFGNRPDRIRILRAEAVGQTGAPGTILDDEMTVACGHGAIRILEGQRASRVVMAGREIMRRESVAVGATFMRPEKSSSAQESRI